MKRLLIAALVVLHPVAFALEAHAGTPVHQWSQDYGATGSDFIEVVVCDAAGNAYIAGNFSGSVSFGGTTHISEGFEDIFIAKYNASGAFQWSMAAGGPESDAATAIHLDGSGNLIVGGYFTDSAVFPSGILVSAGLFDMFLAKVTPTGVMQWAQRYGSTNDEYVAALATESSGSIVVSGFFFGTTNVGGGNLISAGASDIVIAKYTALGTHISSQRLGGTGSESAQDIVVDTAGNLTMTGYFQNTVNFGGGNLVSVGGTDIFIARYNSAVVHQWSNRFGSTASDAGNSIALDASGNAVITGYFTGSVNFGGGALASAGSTDIVYAAYNSAGVHQWSRRLGGTGADAAASVAVHATGNVFLSGYFSSTVNFGGGNVTSAGNADIFLAAYDAVGKHRWSVTTGNTVNDVAEAIAIDNVGSVVAGGYYSGTINLGGSPLVSAGSSDVFVAKFAQNPVEPFIASIEDIGNDQGRAVKIRFQRSGRDHVLSLAPVMEYEAYRRDDAPPAGSLAHRDPVGLSERELMIDGWTFAGSVPSHGETTYGIDAPTIGDSTVASGQYFSKFFIRAATASPFTFFDSGIDSGYSVDNLAPGIPGSLLYGGGVLSWNESPAQDFDYFTVYGAATDNFSAAVLVDYTVTPSMDVTAAPYPYYFVTATDFSGNEGAPIDVGTATDIGETPARYVLSVSNYPNPFNPRTTVSYTVPSRGVVNVAVYDARGARVATLLKNEEREAGAYRLEWNGRADSGEAASSGIYFARVEHAGATRTKKMVLLK